VIALLDGDQPGDDARKVLQRGGPRRKQLLNPDFVLQLSDDALKDASIDNPEGCIGIEDLVPLPLAVEAARRYCEEFVRDVNVESIIGRTVIRPSFYNDSCRLTRQRDRRMLAASRRRGRFADLPDGAGDRVFAVRSRLRESWRVPCPARHGRRARGAACSAQRRARVSLSRRARAR
jgi:hypothetical protein